MRLSMISRNRTTLNSLPAKYCFPIFYCFKIHLYSSINLYVLLHNLSLRITSNISFVQRQKVI